MIIYSRKGEETYQGTYVGGYRKGNGKLKFGHWDMSYNSDYWKRYSYEYLGFFDDKNQYIKGTLRSKLRNSPQEQVASGEWKNGVFSLSGEKIIKNLGRKYGHKVKTNKNEKFTTDIAFSHKYEKYNGKIPFSDRYGFVLKTGSIDEANKFINDLFNSFNNEELTEIKENSPIGRLMHNSTIQVSFIDKNGNLLDEAGKSKVLGNAIQEPFTIFSLLFHFDDHSENMNYKDKPLFTIIFPFQDCTLKKVGNTNLSSEFLISLDGVSQRINEKVKLDFECENPLIKRLNILPNSIKEKIGDIELRYHTTSILGKRFSEFTFDLPGDKVSTNEIIPSKILRWWSNIKINAHLGSKSIDLLGELISLLPPPSSKDSPKGNSGNCLKYITLYIDVEGEWENYKELKLSCPNGVTYSENIFGGLIFPEYGSNKNCVSGNYTFTYKWDDNGNKKTTTGNFQLSGNTSDVYLTIKKDGSSYKYYFDER